MRRCYGLLAATAMLLGTGPARSGPLAFDLPLGIPPVIADSQAPASCTVTYLIADLSNNDLYAARMRIAGAETDLASGNRLPCPADLPPRLSLRAIDVCTSRTGEAKLCVFADMGRGFEQEPDIRNSSANAARCSSDKSSDIAAACWMSGRLAICNVGCGDSPQAAMSQARTRCEAKQLRACPITATVPVAGP